MTRLLSMPEVSERLDKPLETLKRWRKTGYGPPSFLIGRSVRYDESDLDAWIDRQKAKSLTGDTAAGHVG